LLVAAIVVWQVWQATEAARREESWARFLTHQEDPDALQEIATAYAKEPAGAWSLLIASDGHLRKAQATVYTNREEAESLVKQAIDGFKQSLQFAGSGDARRVMRIRALYGLAQAYETQYAMTGDEATLELAVTHYRQLADMAGDDPLAQAAQQRLEDLNSPETRRFYTWFATTAVGAGGDAERDAAGSPFDLRSLPGAPDRPSPDVETPDLPDTPAPAESSQAPASSESSGTPASEEPAKPAPAESAREEQKPQAEPEAPKPDDP
jgi:hypothetical protein